MIVGIGMDLVEHKRIKGLDKHEKDKLALFILHANERKQFTRANNRVQFLANRMAAKDAFVKAMGCGICDNPNMFDIEIRYEESGHPYIMLHNQVAELAHMMNITRYHISISDGEMFTVAQVMLEGVDV